MNFQHIHCTGKVSVVNCLESPRVNYLERLFYVLITFALLGPTFGVRLVPGFKLTFFRVALFLLVVSLAFYLFRNKDRVLKMYNIYPVRWYGYFFLFWFAYAILSLSWCFDVVIGIKYLTKLGAMLLLCIAFPYFIGNLSTYKKTLSVLYGVFSLIVLYSLFESITLIHLPSSRVFGKISESVASFFTNQNDLATCVTLALPFLITALFMLPLQKKHKWMIYVTNVLSLYTLMATSSRSNTFLALPLLIVVLLALIPMVIDRNKLTKKNVAKGLGVVLVTILVVNVMSMVFLSPQARQLAKSKLGSTFDMFSDIQQSTWDLGEGEGDGIIPGKTGESATVRKYLILNGLTFLHHSHYLGVGPGNIEPLMKVHATKVNKVNMHNWWAELLVNFGVVVAALYMYLYFGMLWRLFKIARLKYSPSVDPFIRWGAVSSISSLIGYFMGGIAPSTAIHFTPMWISFGLGLAIISLEEKMNCSRTI